MANWSGKSLIESWSKHDIWMYANVAICRGYPTVFDGHYLRQLQHYPFFSLQCFLMDIEFNFLSFRISLPYNRITDSTPKWNIFRFIYWSTTVKGFDRWMCWHTNVHFNCWQNWMVRYKLLGLRVGYPKRKISEIL